MQNNLYQQLNDGFTQNSSFQQMLNNFGGPQGIINKFNTFKNSLQGDPYQMVQQLLQSGKMSQAQYNQLSQIALQFKNLFYKG